MLIVGERRRKESREGFVFMGRGVYTWSTEAFMGTKTLPVKVRTVRCLKFRIFRITLHHGGGII